MSEVKPVHRYKAQTLFSFGGAKIEYFPHGPEVVLATEFDAQRLRADTAEAELASANADKEAYAQNAIHLRTSLDAVTLNLKRADDLISTRTADLLECGTRRKAAERCIADLYSPSAIHAVAKKLAECMDYPWEHMPEQGRRSMCDHAKSIIDAALNPNPEAESHEPQCLLCLDKKTVPGKIAGGFVKDCPDCCGEEG